MSEQKNFSWVATHKGIVEYLKGMENKQEELTGLLKTVGVSINNDQSAPGKFIELKEIDPFTFFMFIYKHGDVNRLKILQAIAGELKKTVPEDTAGIPSVFATNVMMFPFQYERKNEEIKRLWNLFYSALEGTITDEQFSDSLKIYGVGKPKLSSGLFCIDPEKYFPINGPTIPYLKNILNIKTDYNSFSEYMDILKQVKEKINKPFYEISYDAWLRNNPPGQEGPAEPTNYWIFQANPKYYDVMGALGKNTLVRWDVNQHKTKIKKGDKGILWVTGKDSGCYALFNIISDVFELNNQDKVKINVTHNFLTKPIFKEEVLKRLPDIGVGMPGVTQTNVKSTKEQYETLLEIRGSVTPNKYWLYAPGPGAKYWDEFRKEGIMAIGGDELGDLMNYKDIKEITAKLQEEENTTSNKMNDSLCLFEFKDKISKGDVVIVKKGIHALLGYGVVTSDYYFDDEREMYKNWRKVSWELNGEWETEFKLVPKTLTDITKYPTEHPDYKTYYERLMAIMTHPNYKTFPSPVIPSHYPLNTIFYGPPGTGKTYEAIRRAASIVEKREFYDYDEALKKFQEHLGKRIEFITFHQNYSYEDFIQGLRPDTENDADLIFKKRDGIFKRLADRAFKDYQSLVNKGDANNFVILIDEINRANISRVFGELITLIEKDKRVGGEIPLTSKLPSGDDFFVPANLYIIGTMNTADKSIALLDIALRRRFEFEPLYPKYEIEGEPINEPEILRKINDIIIRSKGHDFQIGHSFFMGMEFDLVKQMNTKVIPLLLEYFMNDEEEVKKILTDSGLILDTNSWPIKITGKK